MITPDSSRTAEMFSVRSEALLHFWKKKQTCHCASQVAHFKDYIPQAFPGGHSMILDAEVLLIDTKTSKPLPFGTLGVHKVNYLSLFSLSILIVIVVRLQTYLSPQKAAFQDANVCLFVFDCIYFNGVSLMER